MQRLLSYLQQSALKGSVREWMTPGLAVEFIQPWYTPLSTTPATTGMPVGGIGNSFTVTAAGTTPVLNFIPGIQVQGTAQTPLRLNQFFFAESVVSDPLKIFDFANFRRRLQFYPLVNAAGEPLFPAETDAQDAEAVLNRVVADSGLWRANAARLERWKVELSPKTEALLKAGRTESAEFNACWLMDFFDGTVGYPLRACGALTAEWGEQREFLGQPGYSADAMDYCALYPVAMTEYKGKQIARIRRIQYSPVMPGEEKLSALPVHFTLFSLHNPSAERLRVTLVQIQENLCGYQVLKERQGVQDASFNLQAAARFPAGESFEWSVSDGRSVRGSEFSSAACDADFDGRMALAVCADDSVAVTVKPIFYADQQESVLRGALMSGRVNRGYVRNVYSGRETMAGALCATVELAPGQSAELVFSMVLDFPRIAFNGLTSAKKYTVYYPESAGRAQKILRDMLERERNLRAEIPERYEALLSRDRLSRLYPAGAAEYDRFRTLAINTLGFLAEATVWDKDDRFLVRECADYPFFNSLDVYFYGSFALMALLPRLDGEVLRRFAQAVLAEDGRIRRHHEYVNHPHADLPDLKLEGPRGVRGAVIHDLGSPFDPLPDAYDWHNVKEWKDLAPKFVLMVWRHARVTEDRGVLADCREAVYEAMRYLEAMVEPGQNFPLTRGTDDTFDNLSSHGISVYCGSLWIAGLRAAAKIAEELGDHGQSRVWAEWADRAQREFHEALWDAREGYFHFFVTPVSVHDLRMDQLGALRQAFPTVLGDARNAPEAVVALNRYLNAEDLCSPLSRLEQRRQKKLLLWNTVPEAFADSFARKLNLDSDDIFADSLLADTYLRLLGLRPLTEGDQARRTLRKIFDVNYRLNSPRIGAANLVHRDGSPLDEFNFQAHDVWIGIQYSLMTAMALHGMAEEARVLGESMVRNLYEEARIPFAAPEGFNGSCRLSPRDLVALGITAEQAAVMIARLKEERVLLADGRVSPDIPRDPDLFKYQYGRIVRESGVEAKALFRALHGAALKYTAGRYFRPGMVWAVPWAC